MIDKLEAGKTYRLVDRDAYLAACDDNIDILEEYFTNDMVTLGYVSCGYGESCGGNVIAQGESQFFELVEEHNLKTAQLEEFTKRIKEVFNVDATSTTENNVFTGSYKAMQSLLKSDLGTPEKAPKLWDGKSELEVGMLVKEAARSIDSAFLVKVIKGTQVVLEDEHGLYMSYTKNLSTLLPDPKEEFCNLMLEKVRRLSLDNAWDTSFDTKKLSGMCWEELNGK